MKKSIIIVLILCVVLAWFGMGKSYMSNLQKKNDLVEKAKISTEAGRYEEAKDYYLEANSISSKKEYLYAAVDAMEKYHTEEKNEEAYNKLISTLETITTSSNEVELWEKLIKYYMEDESYRNVSSSCKAFFNLGLKSTYISQIYTEVTYKLSLSAKSYYTCKTIGNGFWTVYTGSEWIILDANNEKSTSYNFASIKNSDEEVLITNNIDSRIIDKDSIVRARFNFKVEDAGIYSNDLIPLKSNGKWAYYNTEGEKVIGDFDYAGSFVKGVAAVKNGAKWALIATDGDFVTAYIYDDIIVDAAGRYTEKSIYLAKTNGKYNIYNSKNKVVGDFSCDNADFYYGTGPFAFAVNGKWGFADDSGKIIIEPAYQGAKSFSNAVAAVSNNGLWGFINEDNQLVIKYEFADGAYFFEENRTFIKVDANYYKELQLKYR